MTFAEWLRGIEKIKPEGWQITRLTYNGFHGGTTMWVVEDHGRDTVLVDVGDAREFDEAFRKWAEGVKQHG